MLVIKQRLLTGFLFLLRSNPPLTFCHSFSYFWSWDFFFDFFFPPFILTQSAYCPPESRDALVCYLATVSTDTKLLPFSPVLLHHNSPLSPPVLFCVHFLKPADGANLLAPRVQWVSSGRSRGITGRRWSINCGQMKSSHHCH